MIPPFYIGQRVVAVRDSTNGFFKKGEEFNVKNIKWVCKCTGYVVDIGRVQNRGFMYCSECTYSENTNVAWAASTNFAPIQEAFQAISYTKILEEELSSVN